MNVGAQAFALILAILVDPRTSDEDVEAIVYNDLTEDAARKMLVALAAMHSACIEEGAARESISMDRMMRKVRRVIRENTAASERLAGGQ